MSIDQWPVGLTALDCPTLCFADAHEHASLSSQWRDIARHCSEPSVMRTANINAAQQHAIYAVLHVVFGFAGLGAIHLEMEKQYEEGRRRLRAAWIGQTFQVGVND